jgi:hypothetical protein
MFKIPLLLNVTSAYNLKPNTVEAEAVVQLKLVVGTNHE